MAEYKDIVLAVVGGGVNQTTAGDGLSFLSASGQTIAGVVSAIGPIGGAIAVNPGAGLITLIKVGYDASQGSVSVGDAISIVGNSVTFAAAICAVVPGGQPIALGLAAVGRALIFSGVIASLLDVSYPLSGPPSPAISPILGSTPDPLVKTIKYVPYVDPLILDLDGDGLEITPLSNGILFDANGDTIKTATAWAGADDGLLVWDRNGNGSIDSGRELFGDETMLVNGQKAANGFAALAELDTGSLVNGVMVGAGDGKFDANDAQYANLRVWRDLNQDGISQVGELQTLAQSGVQSINLTSTASSTSYANGNATLVQSGSFTRTDGSAGQAGSFILAQDNFIRASESIALGAAATAMALKIATKSMAGGACRFSSKGRSKAKHGIYRRRRSSWVFSKTGHRIGATAKAVMGDSKTDALLGKVLMQDAI